MFLFFIIPTSTLFLYSLMLPYPALSPLLLSHIFSFLTYFPIYICLLLLLANLLIPASVYSNFHTTPLTPFTSVSTCVSIPHFSHTIPFILRTLYALTATFTALTHSFIHSYTQLNLFLHSATFTFIRRSFSSRSAPN